MLRSLAASCSSFRSVFAAEVEAVTTDALLFKRMVLLKFVEPVLMHTIKFSF
jgi:hypothetical protein